VRQPTHPPDKTPRDFFVFPRIKNNVEGKRFEGAETIKLREAATFKDSQNRVRMVFPAAEGP
jgi:hypothetical protein